MRYSFLYIILLVSSFNGFAQCDGFFDLGSNDTICQGSVVTLNIEDEYISYLWQDGSTNNSFQASNSGYYYCVAEQVDSNTNLIQNGDFEQGNVLFTTDYTYYLIADVFGPQASYGIIQNANTWFNPFAPCTDHTSSLGNMLVADGSSVNAGNDAIWCQNVPVNPQTSYSFGYWLQSLTGSPFANLRVEINGVVISNSLAPNTLCTWQEVNYIWNSNASNMAQICIYDNELAVNGNDFAIDDIYLNPVCEYSDTVYISVVPSDTLKVSQILCDGDSVFLENKWQTTAGKYIDTSFILGCIQFVETTISFLPKPRASIVGNTIVNYGDEVNLTAENTLPGTTFTWFQNATEISNEQTILLTPNENVEITLVATRNGCSTEDKVSIAINELVPLIPSAFSPNGDGINDFFRVVNAYKFNQIQLSIYDRWGAILHTGRAYNHAWDGSFKGVEKENDVYTYYIKYKALKSSQDKYISGTVTLIR